MADTPRLLVTPVTVGFFLSIVSALTVGWNAVGYFKGIEQKNVEQDYRLDRSDKDNESMQATMKENSKEVSSLRESIVRLTTVIESSTATKRADFFLGPHYPQNLTASEDKYAPPR